MNTGGDFQATFDQQQQQSQQFNDTGVATVSSSSSCSTSSSNSSNGRRASDVSVGSSSSDSGNSSNNVSPANNTTNTNNDQQQGQQQGNGQTTPLVVVHPVANYPTTSVQQQQQLMQPQSSSNSNFLPNFPIPQTFSSHFPIPIGGGNCGGSGGGAFTRFDSSAPTSTNNKIKVTLANADLWRKFNRFTNEMVVTRPGRKMFPKIELNITGLIPTESYSLQLGMRLIDNTRWKYQAGAWSSAGQDDAPPRTRYVFHHDAPWATGEHWMKDTIQFDRVKLTNRTNITGSHVSLVSMHKYQPVIFLQRVIGQPSSQQKEGGMQMGAIEFFEFPETWFISVTAYQNEEIIKLKVEHNPFAKGFREGSLRKRSLSESPNNQSAEPSPKIPFRIPAAAIPYPPYPFNYWYPTIGGGGLPFAQPAAATTSILSQFPVVAASQIVAPLAAQQSFSTVFEQLCRQQQQQRAAQTNQNQQQQQQQQVALFSTAAGNTQQQRAPSISSSTSSSVTPSSSSSSVDGRNGNNKNNNISRGTIPPAAAKKEQKPPVSRMSNTNTVIVSAALQTPEAAAAGQTTNYQQQQQQQQQAAAMYWNQLSNLFYNPQMFPPP